MNPRSANPQPDTTLRQKSRLCYVIMPFSTTASCSEEEWTQIFKELIKPAVESAELGYECRRSEATRGNIIAAIIQSLDEAYVVIADLTDQNPNVFYELGVRHALRNRTILLSQDRKFIPFDLRSYANHVYEWRTPKGHEEFRAKLKELLAHIDAAPDRSDNPVSDFLGEARRERQAEPEDETAALVAREETAVAQSLAGPESAGVRASQLGLSIGQSQNLVALRTILRLTRKHFSTSWPKRVAEMNLAQSGSHNIGEGEMYDYAAPLIAEFSRDVEKVESFALSLVDSEWAKGVQHLLALVEDWITYSENRSSGTTYKAIQGSPALCAFRLLCLMGAKAMVNESMSIVKTLLRHPIETTKLGDQLDRRSLAGRIPLFHPEALFGRADLAVRYLSQLYKENKHVAEYFVSEGQYHQSLSQFLLMACTAVEVAAPTRGHRMYPGYAMLPGAGRAIDSLFGQMHDSPQFLDEVANVYDESSQQFKQAWPERAGQLNAALREVSFRFAIDDFSLPSEI